MHDYVENGTESELWHIGVKRRSGRYPWGSGQNPHQHDEVKQMKQELEDYDTVKRYYEVYGEDDENKKLIDNANKANKFMKDLHDSIKTDNKQFLIKTR
jgi:GTP cyclohydrolase I